MTDLDLHVGVLGATGLVGRCVLAESRRTGWSVTAFSRQSTRLSEVGVSWQLLSRSEEPTERISYWICAAPIWVLPDYFQMLESCGVRKVVAVSSTSRFTKDQSSDLEEQSLAKRLTDAEYQVKSWAERRSVEWVFLRPTLIYGLGRDKNISEIVWFISRFGFFPLFGNARGLRQPIHAEDVAAACIAALHRSDAANRAFNISGGETLTYRNMVTRVFDALGRRPRALNVPLWMFSLAVALFRLIPRYRHWSAAMAERMNRDLVFDHVDATRALGFKPRGFVLTPRDLP